ncbi:MAG TPA: F0F1 ATP synthase subunit delta [Afifellaceae bacterium]|nr:F0F1 ATP synthase subunit delta [Afifellaceae bacterium]
MSDHSSSVSGVAERYASALFELAQETSTLEDVETDLKTFREMLKDSADLKRVVISPVFSAEEQEKAIGAVSDKAEIKSLVGNFVRLLAHNRRLFVLPDAITGFMDMLAEHRGEVTAEVISARKLSAEHLEDLKKALKASLGKDPAIEATVDPAILGGLIVKVGSRMIDSSVRTKLNSITSRLKEAS